MKTFVTILVLSFLLLLASNCLNAQIPRTISYQGLLTDSLGIPKPDASYQITFRLYDVSSGGSAFWTESKTLATKRGLFTTALGDQAPLDQSIKFDTPYWLGIQVESEEELSPRLPLSSVAYSFNAVHSDTASFAKSIGSVLSVDSLAYTHPRTHLLTLSGEAFNPTVNVDFYNSGGMGGAGLGSGAGRMCAPIYLPDGATITKFTLYYYDNSTSDLTAYLQRAFMAGAYDFIGTVSPTGTPGYSNISTTDLSYATVDNQHYGYVVIVYSGSWDGSNLRIMGTTIEYTTPGPE